MSHSPPPPHLALTIEPCAFKSRACLWFPPPTAQGVPGDHWLSGSVLSTCAQGSWAPIGAKACLSSVPFGSLAAPGLGIVRFPGFGRSIPRPVLVHQGPAGPGPPGSYWPRPWVDELTPGRRYRCSARGGPGSPSTGSGTHPSAGGGVACGHCSGREDLGTEDSSSNPSGASSRLGSCT